MQLTNPYAFPGGAPTRESAAMQAVQACREQVGQSIQDLLAQNDIELPADAFFRLTVDSKHTIRVSGLDEKLTASVEKALNTGDNGKNLYNLLKITSPDAKYPGINYIDGHLEPVAPQQELSDESLEEIKKQAGPVYAQYSTAYNPHQKSLAGDKILGLDPSKYTQEDVDRLDAIARMGIPTMLARDKAGEFGTQTLTKNGPVLTGGYLENFYEETAASAMRTIQDYYAAAHRENSSYPYDEAVQHIADKYQNPDSEIFRYGLPPEQRSMYFRQEMALLNDEPLYLWDPYALASLNGTWEHLNALWAAVQADRAKNMIL